MHHAIYRSISSVLRRLCALSRFSTLTKPLPACVLQERLLGVSMTGIMDNRLMSGQLGMDKLELALDEVKQAAIKANAEMAAELGFPAAAAVTCVKPSGTVSQLCDSASGIHPRHSKYYIRRVRCNKDDPLTNFMLQVSVGLAGVVGGNLFAVGLCCRASDTGLCLPARLCSDT